MKKSIKTFLILLLSILCLTSFACVKESFFENFNDETVQAVLGEKYQLDIASIKDKNGNYYEVTAEVVDSRDKKVDSYAGFFKVTDIDGYKITYTVAKGTSKETKRIVIVNVKNVQAPNIVLGECANTFKINDTFVFPSITVYDLLEENIVPTVKVVNSQGVECELSADKKSFVCTTSGTYKLVITAVNSAGVEGSLEYDFYVRQPAEKGEVEAFNDYGSLEEIKTSTYVNSATWSEKSLGKNGVLKLDVKTSNQWVEFVTINPCHDYLAYLEVDGNNYKNQYFVLTMYVDAPVGSVKGIYPLSNGTSANGYKIKDIKYGMWYDYIIDAKLMLDNYKAINDKEQKGEDSATLKSQTHSLRAVFLSDATIYLDKITFVESLTNLSDENILSTTDYKFGETIDFSKLIKSDGNKTMLYTILIDDKPVGTTNDKYTPEYVSDNYSVVASITENANMVGQTKTYKFKVKDTHKAELVSTSTIPTLKIMNGTDDVTSSYNITSELEFVSNAGKRESTKDFVATKNGCYEIILKATNPTTNVKFIKMTTVKVGNYLNNEVISATRADATELFGTSKATIIENSIYDKDSTTDYKGAKLISFTKPATDNNPTFKLNFKPVHNAEHYEEIGAEYICFPMYIKSGNTKISEFKVTIFEKIFTVPATTWTTIEVPAELFIEYLKNDKLFPIVTWMDTPISITPTTDSIAQSVFNLYLGDIIVRSKSQEDIDSETALANIINGLTTENYTQYYGAKDSGIVKGTFVTASEAKSIYKATGDYTGSAVAFKPEWPVPFHVTFPKGKLATEGKFYVWVAMCAKDGYTPGSELWQPNAGAKNAIFGFSWENMYRFSNGALKFNQWHRLEIDASVANSRLEAEGSLKLFQGWASGWNTDNYTLLIGNIGIDTSIS